MSNTSMVKNFIAGSAVPAFSIVKTGASDGVVGCAAAVADFIIGVSTDIPAVIGERCDVILSGIADVVYGGTVTRGDWITCDSSGRAVTAAPAAGINHNVIGRAFVSGVIGDIGSVVISQSRIQG
jgi:Uncharacterized conserved protein (DUF2190)